MLLFTEKTESNIIAKYPRLKSKLEQIPSSKVTIHGKTHIDIGSSMKKFSAKAEAFRHSSDGFCGGSIGS